MTNRNEIAIKSDQSQTSSNPKPVTQTPSRPAPSQGQTVSQGGKKK